MRVCPWRFVSFANRDCVISLKQSVTIYARRETKRFIGYIAMFIILPKIFLYCKNNLKWHKSKKYFTETIQKLFSFKGKYTSFSPGLVVLYNRAACTKFRHPALSSECYNNALNKECVAAVGMLRKESPFES